MFKVLFTEFCNCACAKKDCYAYQNSSYLCCINTQENCIITWNKLRNQFWIYQICKKNVFLSQKQTGNIKCLVIFDLSRFSITFFHLPNQVDLSAHCSYHFSTSNMLRLRCNNTLIFLWKFQCWNFKLGQFDENTSFSGGFSKRSTHIFGCHMSKTTISFSRIWLAVEFWRPKLCEISVQIFNLKNWTPVTLKWHFLACFYMLPCASVYWCLVVPCLEKADLLALVCDV